MKFKTLQENLRKAINERVDDRELTQLKLAAQTGFKQAHISNFLSRKRGLSLEGMDKVLQVQRISVLDLLDPAEVNKRASIVPPAEAGFENVLLVDAAVAATRPRIVEEQVRDILKYKKAFLRRLRPAAESARRDWRRFVLIKVDARDGMSMYPRLLPGATVLIDRHYNSLAPYRRGEQNMYAVRKNGTCTVRYVQRAGGNLILRPHNGDYPIEVLAVEEGRKYQELIVGRICHVGIET
jgi:hypothetical protein